MSSLSLQKEQLILFPWHFQFANNSYSSSVSNTLFAIGLLGIAAILLAAIMGFFTSMTIFPRNSSRQHRRNDESTTTSLKNHNTNYMRIPKNGQGKGNDRKAHSVSMEEFSKALIIKEWSPLSQSLLRGRPIQSDEAAPLVTAVGPGTSVSTIDTPVAIAELIANCNTICKSFSWSDDGEKEDHEDEDRDDEASIDSFCNGLFWERRAIDLIEAGVFKRTFEILKEQPRCMLCSVCFRTGDMVTESCNGRQVCHHQFHPGCLLNWVRKKTTTSSRSKPTTGKGDSCIGAIGVCCPICKEVYTEL